MTEPEQAGPDERLPPEAARRLLARASEIDAARGADPSVAELREAAREAGIAPEAFEAALAEHRARVGLAPAGARPPRLARLWPGALAAAAALAALRVAALLFPT
jgi:hypothetical protein